MTTPSRRWKTDGPRQPTRARQEASRCFSCADERCAYLGASPGWTSERSQEKYREPHTSYFKAQSPRNPFIKRLIHRGPPATNLEASYTCWHGNAE